MKEVNSLKDVAKFHKTFGAPIEEHPIIPAQDRCQLRVDLLQEELNELKEAIQANDLVEVADALCDIQYVLSGAILEFGLGNKFKELFDEVQRSNMSKACQSMDEAVATQKKYADRGVASIIREQADKFMVYRLEDEKVLKSVNYSPADLSSLL